MAFDTTSGKYYLLSSQARVQVPYIKVTIGKYVFGVFSKESKNENNLKQFEIEYPNYIQSLSVTKINGMYIRLINSPIQLVEKVTQMPKKYL